jgi:uncharacterized protein (DUF1800 family)
MFTRAGPRTLIPLCAALASACATTATRPEAPTSRSDVLWIERVTYGIDSASLEEVRRHGRAGYLDAQLADTERPLPEVIGRQIDALQLDAVDAAQILTSVAAEYRRINALAEGADKEQARRTLGEQGNKLAYAAVRRDLLRAIYSPSQLKEQLVWFWLNHFAVSQYKANVRWVIGDYEEHAIRPHVFGHFRELVMATLTHPAMLQYLDNAQNAVGHVNENYARELMELHTLGVDAGYTQQDVQELARILTGVGLVSASPPHLKTAWQPLYHRSGGFEFNPARHDFGSKVLLGHRIEGRGFDEVAEAVDLLVRSPACARFITRKLATYFVSDSPSPQLLARLQSTFARTDGDIGAVLRVLFASPELDASLGTKFKDPMHYVVSAVRLAYDTRAIVNTHPIVNWLNGLGEPPYGHPTPDGYPLAESGWAGSGQMVRRFEIARAIASGNAGLFEPEDGSPATTTGFPQLATRLYYAVLEPSLSSPTRVALERAGSQQEWNTFLLASPEFNYR